MTTENPWTITDQDVADQIDNAHYAGYPWFGFIRDEPYKGEYPGTHVAAGGRLCIRHYVDEDHEFEDHHLALEDFKRAIRKYAKGGKLSGPNVPDWPKRTPRDILENGDASDSDNIIQLAVLGEIVYA